MSQDCRDQGPEGLVAKLFESVGPPRRLGPVLAELVELVGRGSGGDAECQHILQGPGVGPGRMHPDGQVGHHPQGHAGAQRLDCARAN